MVSLLRVPAVLALAWILGPAAVAAQEPAEAVLRGEVRAGGGVPVEGATVVLHQVGADFAGEVDSVRTAGSGAFRLTLPRVPDPGSTGAVYFASVRHQGILYFGPPVASAQDADSLYRIQVYDTVVAPPEGAPLTPRVRYILAEEVPDGYQVTDLVQLDVQGERTWVAADSGYTWSYPLPEGVREIQIGGGDVAPEAAVVDQGSLRIRSPLSPGLRQTVVRYIVDSLFLTIAVPGGVEEMDFLVRQPAPEVQVQGLFPAEVVEMEGATYQRFAATNLPDTTVVVTSTPRPWAPSPRWLAVGMAFLLALGGLYFGLRRRPDEVRNGGDAAHAAGGEDAVTRAGTRRPGPEEGRGRSTREELLVQVARLDLALEEAPAGPERARLQQRRNQLLDRLRHLP